MLPASVNYATRIERYTRQMETIGDRIRHLRRAKGYSQQQLADLLGLTKGAVSQWELGLTKNLKNAPLMDLCKIFGVSAEYLVNGAARAPRGKPPTGALGSENSPT